MIGSIELFRGLEWTRPLALIALALPIAVLVLARLVRRPAPIATGTVEVWSRIARSSVPPVRERRMRVPLAVWMLALALVFGALALAGPERARPTAERVWRIVVDRSPSMYLKNGASLRVEQVLASARVWLASAARERDAFAWITSDGARTFEVRASDPPTEWLAPPPIDADEPEWSRFDAPGTLWITDRMPATPPHSAGVIASGGVAAPGPAAASGTTRWDWNGAELVEAREPPPLRRVQIDAALPSPLRRAVEAWALARGLALDAARGAELALAVRTSPVEATEAPTEVAAGRDGWSARGSIGRAAASRDASGDLETWLSSSAARAPSAASVSANESELPLVTWGPGRIESAWLAMDEPRGDPSAFIVSWARLFDRAVQAPAGFVDVHERSAAGAASIQPPRSPPIAEDALRPQSSSIDAWLAVVACVLALLAFALAAITKPAPRASSTAAARAQRAHVPRNEP